MSEQKQKTASKQEDVEEVEVAQHDVAELIDETDDLLDDIDDVLEENAQEFVAAFVQQGGQ